MKKYFNWQFKLGVVLVLLSVIFYLIHYLIFRDFREIINWLINNVAFLFINILIVVIILQRLLEQRDKQAILRKLNMVIGTFFNEVGVEAMRMFSALDNDLPVLGKRLLVSSNWTDKDFAAAKKFVTEQQIAIEKERVDYEGMKCFFKEKRDFLLILLENPNLLEHESFTDLLWAVFHLTDELAHRKSFTNLPEPDIKHLAGDINRAYRLIIVHWLDYMQHLKHDYPYLFSLAVRTNPFDENASIEVKQ
ncbi:MAG: hypothetical protein WCI43_03690 [Candidatus Firestonebacteria bacterium]